MKKSSIHDTLTLVTLIFIGRLAFYSLTAQAAMVWTPQPGIYQKQLSSAAIPRTRYVLIAPAPIATTADPCLKSAKFKCDADWGVVFNLDESIAGQCTRLYVKKTDLSDAAIYSGMKVVNGVAVCP